MNKDKGNVLRFSRRGWVSIGVPIYRRLEYLSSVLRMVGEQDYPYVELIVSDNGLNGAKVRDFVTANYSRSFRFRQNDATVDITRHFNQIISEATGEYFVLLNDDDEISSNFVSELVARLEEHPEASVAYARQELINSNGELVKVASAELPEILSGSEFIRATWERGEFGYENVESFLTRTRLLREVGGYPGFTKGNHIDDAAVIRLSLGNYVVFSSKCVFRFRVHEGGYGWQVSASELAAACRQFMRFLNVDTHIRKYGLEHHDEWRELKEILVRMSWNTYLWRWKDIYRQRMSATQWVKAAFAMPLLPEYYRKVATILRSKAKARVKCLLGYPEVQNQDFFKRRCAEPEGWEGQ